MHVSIIKVLDKLVFQIPGYADVIQNGGCIIESRVARRADGVLFFLLMDPMKDLWLYSR